MPNLSLLRLTAILVCGSLPLIAHAQAERWYQVELLIFSHEDTVTSEQWEPLPVLSYPEAARFLVYTDQLEARVAEQRAAVQRHDCVGDRRILRVGQRRARQR